MKVKTIAWRGRKEEGMCYRQKVKLMKRIELVLVLNDLAMKDGGEEGLSAARAERIKAVYGKGLKGNVKLFRRLPATLLEGVENMQAFCLGYFNRDTRACGKILLRKYGTGVSPYFFALSFLQRGIGGRTLFSPTIAKSIAYSVGAAIGGPPNIHTLRRSL